MVLKKHSFKCILMYKHTWIHRLIFLRNEETLDQFSPEKFFGKALVVDCRDLKEGQAITIDKINIDKAKLAEFLLFNLGWDKRWNLDTYFNDYPCIDDTVLEFILNSKAYVPQFLSVQSDKIFQFFWLVDFIP